MNDIDPRQVIGDRLAARGFTSVGRDNDLRLRRVVRKEWGLIGAYEFTASLGSNTFLDIVPTQTFDHTLYTFNNVLFSGGTPAISFLATIPSDVIDPPPYNQVDAEFDLTAVYVEAVPAAPGPMPGSGFSPSLLSASSRSADWAGRNRHANFLKRPGLGHRHSFVSNPNPWPTL
jgi:hypothetical protein